MDLGKLYLAIMEETTKESVEFYHKAKNESNVHAARDYMNIALLLQANGMILERVTRRLLNGELE